MIYKFVFFVPTDYLELVKNAIFDLGIGQYDNYSHCAWQTLGKGQFKPLKNSDPHIGNKGEITYVEEYKVELICLEKDLDNIINTLIKTHPYEEPVYEAWPILKCSLKTKDLE